MRNLKRALSLLLAAAMLIGMMVVGASAVSYNDFPDRDEIVNKDAVSMLTTLGIIEGTDQGTYNPTGDVDRAQMAKMISVALTNNEDCDTLYQNVNSGLTDIAANWARGYINYCYTLGIIAGRGDNTFDPSANVTGVEAAKMLLTALGYDANIEGLVGNDWALNTAALAQNLGIFRNFTKDVSEPLNRDDAALLIYNALDVELIQEYRNGYAISYDDHRTILSSVFGVMRVEGVVVANEWAQLQETDSDAALREGRTTLDNVVVYDSTTSNTVVPEGVREDDPVTFNVATPVEYMGKAVTMYVEKTTILANSKVIGVATDDDANVINFTAESQDTAKDYLKGTGVAVDDNTEYYVNYGYFKDQDAAIDWINENYYDDGGSDFGRNGIEVQVIDNNDDGTAEYVLYLQETLSEVIRYNERNETLSFYAPTRTTRNVLTGKTENVTEDMADVVSAEKVSLNGVTTTDTLSLEAEDLILYVQYGGRTYVANPEIVTGKMTRVDRDKDDELYITIDDGETYYQSYILDAASMVDVDLTHFDIDTAAKDVPGFDTTYDFILDSNGYVVAVRPAEDVVTNYALVLDSAWTQNALTRGGEIKVLMADGTENTFDINWKESAKAFDNINRIHSDNVTGQSNDSKLESYLGSRDVVQNPDGRPESGLYATSRAVGSIIEYSLNEAGDELTIERVLQGNTFESDGGLGDTLEIDANTNVKTTAGVADDGNVIFLDGTRSDNLQYVAYDGYDNGYGRITVSPSARSDMAGRTESKTYAVDLNTVAFYFFDEDGDGVADSGEYGVATGWDKMSDIDEPTDVQVYPVLEKTANREYKASNLADVILFEAKPDTVADNYMLILSANAVGKDLLELNVVFEDGTVEAIQIDDQGSFDEDDRTDFMMAWTYSENADGTYDIGTPAQYSGTADLLINGTVDLNNGIYLALPSTAAVWDVTEVDSANDTVTTGRFQQNVVVNTVIIVSEGKVRTAWIWDADSTTIGGDFDWNWDTTGFETVYPFSGWGQWQIQQYLFDDKNVRVLGDLTLSDNLYIPEGTILQVEGDLRENGNTVTGDGALRIRDDYYVNNNGKADLTSTVTVNTQVGNDMLLAETTSISSRVGVYGDIVGNTTNNATIAANLIQDLTVDATGNVYVYGDVMVDYLIVNGHIEANHYYINGGEVNSTRTLIARGNVTVYGGGTDPRRGTLTIGNTSAGSATVGGVISGSNLNVNNGTLTLSNTASINMTGNVTVGKNGEIYQNRGTARNLEAANVSISGVVSISGTIVTGTLTLNNTADVTVVGNPVYTTLNGTGSINANMDILPGGSTTTPVAGNWLTSMKVKGVNVTLNQNTKTGSVVLTGAQAASNALVYSDVELYNNAYNYVVTLNGAAVTTTGDATLKNGDIIRVTITNAANEQQTYVITVTVASASYTVTIKGDNLSTKKVENAQTVDKTDYVVANDAVVFTVKPAAGFSVTGVSYTVGGQGNYTLDVNAENRYTIPASHVTGDIVITVTTDETPVPANVTLTENTGVAMAFELDGSGDSYVLTVPHDYVITEDTITDLVTVSGEGSTKGTWKLEGDTFTGTFEGNQDASTADDQTVTVKVVNVTEAQAAARNESAIREALAETLTGTTRGLTKDAAQKAAAEAVKAEVIKIQSWLKNGQKIALADENGVVATYSGNWSAPSVNDSRVVEFSVVITLADNTKLPATTVSVDLNFAAN